LRYPRSWFSRDRPLLDYTDEEDVRCQILDRIELTSGRRAAEEPSASIEALAGNIRAGEVPGTNAEPPPV